MTRPAWSLLLAWALVLAGCARPTIVEERIERVSVPVATGCLAGARPERVMPLSAQFDAAAWAKLTPRQKAARVGLQALAHQGHAELLEAATTGCK
jgi:hypothetical protein